MAAVYRLSELAAQDISDIYDYSLAHWGEARADRYVESIYRALETLTKHPDHNIGRHERAAPFRMIAAGEHFILYEIVNDDIIVLTMLHQSQDVESRVAKLTPKLRKVIARMMKPWR